MRLIINFWNWFLKKFQSKGNKNGIQFRKKSINNFLICLQTNDDLIDVLAKNNKNNNRHRKKCLKKVFRSSPIVTIRNQYHYLVPQLLPTIDTVFCFPIAIQFVA